MPGDAIVLVWLASVHNQREGANDALTKKRDEELTRGFQAREETGEDQPIMLGLVLVPGALQQTKQCEAQVVAGRDEGERYLCVQRADTQYDRSADPFQFHRLDGSGLEVAEFGYRDVVVAVLSL